MRQRRKSHESLFGVDEEDDNQTYRVKRKKSGRCANLCRWSIVVVAVACMVYIFYLNYSALLWIEYDRFTGRNVIKRLVPFEMYQSIDTMDRIYPSWDSYSREWHRCLEVIGVSKELGPDSFYSKPLMYGGNVMIKHMFGANSLLEAQSIHIMKTQRKEIRGNFTLPTMYMEQGLELVSNKSVFPCLCSILLDGDENSLDKSIKKDFPNIIHMFNLHQSEERVIHPEDRANFATARISVPMIGTLQQPFKMNIPHHLNISFFRTVGDKFQEENIVFYDSINIINTINCLYLSNVQMNPLWKVQKP
jgi:hypothetical protein